MRLLQLSLVSCAVLVTGYGLAVPSCLRGPARSTRLAPRARRLVMGPDDTGASDDELSKQFSAFVSGRELGEDTRDGETSDEFSDELYEHLSRRPEYENSELYKNLRKRADVADPMYSELEKLKWRELLNATGPSTDGTPGDVIETVLRALRDVDSPSRSHGIELLQRYSSPASALGQEVTPEMLRDYFDNSKYQILLDWVSITYTRKLEISLDKRRALQQVKLKSSAGVSVPVTFQLSQHSIGDGEIWLIDQLLVKSVDPRGD